MPSTSSCTLRLLAVELPDRPHLDAPGTRPRNPRRQLDGVVQIPRLDQVEAAELLLRFGERAVGRRDLRVPAADGRRGVRGLETFTGEVVAAPPDPLGKGHVLAHQALQLVLRQ